MVYIMNNLDDIKYSLNNLDCSAELQRDWEAISSNKDLAIAGFLSIGKKDGWNQSEGGPHNLGFRFTRYMFSRFCAENGDRLCEYKDILSNAFAAFSVESQKSEKFNPRTSIDGRVTGWLEHCVVRVTGYIGSQRTPNSPFFEVLINSARTEINNSVCHPFKVVLFRNSSEAIERSHFLQKMVNATPSIAMPLFYHTSHDSPDEFRIRYQKEHGKAPGPNATRILEGLKFLGLQKMKAQTVGNCWMKQNKRQVLTTLFLETLTQRPELTIHQSWKLSLNLYKRWTHYTREELNKMVTARKGICLDLAIIAERKLQKKLAA